MAAASSSEDAAKQFHFSVLCDYMDRIRRVPKNVGSSNYFKERAIRGLLAKWSALLPEGTRPNYFALVRLLANHYDSRKYNMKTKKLIQKVSKARLLPDATRKSLLAVANKSSSQAVEQLAKEVAARSVPVKKELTIFDVNQSLDHVTETELSEGELHDLLKGCPSEREVFWILQIILRKVESTMGASPSLILSVIHPHAAQMRQAGTTLERICELASENVLQDEESILFRPFAPMLLARIKHGTANVYDKLVQYCGSPFLMQVKFDGEHFLLHRNKGEYRYFSRNQNDHTERIGKLMSPRIDPCFLPSVESCILDGELMLWDIFEKKHVGKGCQASDGRSYDVKSLHGDSAVVSCIAVFDLLYLNGRSLLNVPFNERLDLLHSSVLQKQDPSSIFIGEFEKVSTREEFAKFFGEAMSRHEEGVVVKKIDALYKIGVRYMSNGCFKVKPFHLGDETMDMAIVGVDRAGDGHIESYVVAVLRDGKYFMCGKVGSGLDYNIREQLRHQLTKDHGLLKSDVVPEWIHDDHVSSDLPTDFIHKNNLQVLEVKSKGIMNERLHFPIIKFYRDDKPVKDIDTYEDFLEYDEILRTQSVAKAESAVPVGRKKLTVVPEVMEEYKVTKKSKVESVGTDLKDFQFCVLRGAPSVPTQKLRDIIQSFGGICTANPTKKTQFVITGEPNHMKTKSIIKGNKYNVVHADWLLDSEKAAVVLPINKDYVLHVVDESLMTTFGVNQEDESKEDEEEEDQEPETSEKGRLLGKSGQKRSRTRSRSRSKGKEGVVQEEEGGRGKPKQKRARTSSQAEEWSEKWIKSKLNTVSADETASGANIESLRKQLREDDKFYRFSSDRFYLHESLGPTVQKYARLLLELHGAVVLDSAKNASHIVTSGRVVDDVEKKYGGGVRLVDVNWIEAEVHL